MFEKFTERARHVVVLAQEESRALKHIYIGTEHILLGLLREEEGVAARVLKSLDITVEQVRANVVRIVGIGEQATSDRIPFTPRAKKVLELSLTEALSLGQNFISTEHILLGVVGEKDGVGARILLDFDADAGKIRNAVIQMQPGPGARIPAEVSARGLGRPRKSIDLGWLDGLSTVLNRLGVEIRNELGRDPDAGDLLLALACTPETLAGQALQQLGVDIEALWGMIERARHESSKTHEELVKQIREVRNAKEQAIEAQDFQTAARMRDQQRELVEQTRAPSIIAPNALQAIRRHLGIPNPPDPTQPPSLD